MKKFNTLSTARQIVLRTNYYGQNYYGERDETMQLKNLNKNKHCKSIQIDGL